MTGRKEIWRLKRGPFRVTTRDSVFNDSCTLDLDASRLLISDTSLLYDACCCSSSALVLASFYSCRLLVMPKGLETDQKYWTASDKMQNHYFRAEHEFFIDTISIIE